MTKAQKFILGRIPVRWKGDAWRNRHGMAIELDRTLRLHELAKTLGIDAALRATAAKS